VRRLRAVDFVNSITLFGAALLVSVLPCIILLSSLTDHRIETDLARHIGLNAQGARIVSQLFRPAPSHAVAGIVTGLVIAVAGTAAMASSLQVIYERIFGQPHHGWKDAHRFVVWVIVLLCVLGAESAISEPVRAAAGPVAQGVVNYAGVTAFLWWTMHLLLAGRLSWRQLLRPAILTGLCWIGLEVFASFYLSAQIISDSRLYGTIGVVFTLMVWFIGIGAVLVLGAAAGATWNQRGDLRR
jgi:membrane protein